MSLTLVPNPMVRLGATTVGELLGSYDGLLVEQRRLSAALVARIPTDCRTPFDACDEVLELSAGLESVERRLRLYRELAAEAEMAEAG